MNKLIEPALKTVDQWVEQAASMIPHFLVAALVLLGSFGIGKLLRRLTKRALERSIKPGGSSRSSATVLGNLVFVICILTGVAITAAILGLDKVFVSILGSLGVASLVAGYALKDIAANLFAGIVITLRAPFKKGDYIEVESEIGYVEVVDLLYTTIRTTDGQLTFIPNSLVYSDAVTNYTSLGTRRVVLQTGVSYGDDLEHVRALAIETISRLPDVLQTPPVSLFFTEIGGSSYNFDLRYWIKFDNNTQYRDAMSQGIMALKKAFEDADIDLPFPIQTLDFGVKGGVPLEDVPITIANGK